MDYLMKILCQTERFISAPVNPIGMKDTKVKISCNPLSKDPETHVIFSINWIIYSLKAERSECLAGSESFDGFVKSLQSALMPVP